MSLPGYDSNINPWEEGFFNLYVDVDDADSRYMWPGCAVEISTDHLWTLGPRQFPMVYLTAQGWVQNWTDLPGKELMQVEADPDRMNLYSLGN